MTVAIVDAGPHQVSRSVEVNASAAELFAIVADPRRHHELDGSGTVGDNIDAPAKLVPGARFTTKMTETFDYSDTGPVKDGLKYYQRTGFAKRNAKGIEATLTRLRDHYLRP